METDVATDVVRRLETLGVDYCITGSEALPRYGEPRHSELQLRDCANLLRTNAPAVDWSYLERYSHVLGVEEILARLRAASA